MLRLGPESPGIHACRSQARYYARAAVRRLRGIVRRSGGHPPPRLRAANEFTLRVRSGGARILIAYF